MNEAWEHTDCKLYIFGKVQESEEWFFLYLGYNINHQVTTQIFT